MLTFIPVALCVFITEIEALHLEGPIFVQEPPAWLDFTNSTGAVLTCVVTGIPAPSLMWLDALDSPVTDLPGLREVLRNGSLLLHPFSREQLREDIHTTTYRCLATNPVGKVLSRECKLRPEIASHYQASVETEYTKEGNIAVLKCRIRGGSGRIKVVNWMRQESGGSRFKLVQVQSPKYAMTILGDLHVKSASQSDTTAQFYCQTSNTLTKQKEMSSPGKVFITSNNEKNTTPRIEYYTPNVNAKSGTPTDLICIAQASPSPVYRWYKESNGILDEIRDSMMIKPLDSILKFTRVQKLDAGYYVCEVSNSLGEERRRINLHVYSPLSVNIKPQHQVIDGGSTATLNCSIDGGTGTHNVAWLKDGKPLMDSLTVRLLKNGEMLTISNAQKQDGGMYQCLARTSDETEQASAQVDLGSLPPEFKSTFIEQTVEPSTSVSLSCRASGMPPPRISWSLDGSPLRTRDGYLPYSYLEETGEVTNYLNMSHTNILHGGFYTCTAENRLGQATHSASLNVYGPPMERAPTNATAVFGGDKVLYCPVAGFPVSGINWVYNGETLNIKHKQFPNGTLLLKHLESNDGGKYSCTKHNQQEQYASSYVFLRIMKPPQIQEFHFPTNLQEGNRAHVSCTIISGDLPIEIIWLKDGSQLAHEPDVQLQSHQFVSALLFSNLAARHSGDYTCLARNAAAQANFTSRLIVKVAPTWVVEPTDTSVLYQHAVFLHCQASGYPPPVVTWKKSKDGHSGTALTVLQDERTIIAENGTVIIQSVDHHHKGHYTCEVSNGVGSPLRKTVLLMINVPAYFRNHHVNHNGVAGESLVLLCEAEGDLPLFITWTESPRDSLPISHVRYTSTGISSEITLSNLSVTDAGKYKCNAHNEFGRDSTIIHVSVAEVPEAPKFVEVYDVGSRWTNIRWAPPNTPEAPITNYIVQFREVKSGNSWSNTTINGQSYSTRLGTLLPNTAYELHMMAVNKVGTGPRSEASFFKTLQEAPNVAPTEVIIEASTPESLLVKWKALADFKVDSQDILGYQILYQEFGTEKKTVKTVRGHMRQSVTITGLKQFTKYEVAVRAFNSIGHGPQSTPTILSTLEGVPESPPIDVRCSGISAQSIKVKWEPPPLQYRNGLILGYKVMYKKTDPSFVKSVESHGMKEKKSTSLEVYLHGLDPYANYSVRVFPYTSSGDGVESSTIYCHTGEDIPGPPENVKALVVTSDSILVAWTEPLQPNGNIIKYNIHIKSKSNEIQQETVFGSKSLMYECRRLKEFQRYEFWVTAFTSAGEGPKSVQVDQTPTSRAPARIAMFSRRAFGGEGSSVTLSCYAVGLPAPTNIWRDQNGQTIPSKNDKFRFLSGSSLIVNPLSVHLAGNYSCSVQNVYGKDQIVYEVIVITIPKAPEVAIVHTTTNSIDVQWQLHPKDLHYVTEFILSFKESDGNWFTIILEPDKMRYRLKKLKCGTAYLIMLQSVNAVGKSESSSVTKAYTKGGLPPLPDTNDFILVNSTSVTLFLDAWPINGCQILHFVISYRSALNSYWSLIGENISPNEDVQIAELSPASRYFLNVAIFTEAGTVSHEFGFATKSLNGDSVPLESSPDFPNVLLMHINIIIPVVSGILCTIAVIFCLGVIIKKRFFGDRNPSPKTLIELENKRNNSSQGHPYSPSPGRKGPSSISAHKGSDTSGADYEVCPYATFSLPNQPECHVMRFQTFSQHECCDGPLPKDYSVLRSRNKLETSKSPPDGLSLEISCISSQQTLPVERKSHCKEAETFETRRGITPSFVSDSESSGELRQQRALPSVHKRSTESTVFELDSSTESAEMSPEVAWRSIGEKNIMLSRAGDVSSRKISPGPPAWQKWIEAECDFHNKNIQSEIDGQKRHRVHSTAEKDDYAIHV